jgi:hypothetical protein
MLYFLVNLANNDHRFQIEQCIQRLIFRNATKYILKLNITTFTTVIPPKPKYVVKYPENMGAIYTVDKPSDGALSEKWPSTYGVMPENQTLWINRQPVGWRAL